MLEVLLLLALSVVPSAGIHCTVDEDLGAVQEYSYKPENLPADLDYWKTFQLNFQVYGKFDGDIGDTKVTAGYYTEDGKLVYSITVDCGSETWKSEYIERGDETDTPKIYLKGDLDDGCTAGSTFDIWLKIHQPMLMSWLVSAQPLQTGTEKITINKGRFYMTRIRPHKVKGKYGANKATRFSVTASGAAKFTRFTFGQCLSWPRELESNCMEAKEFVRARSKLHEDAGGAGYFGANNYLFAPVCFENSKYFLWIQDYVHPDMNSENRAYCCCVHMDTGRVFNDNVEENCSTVALGTPCKRSCLAGANNAFISEVTELQNKKEGEVDV